MVRRALSVVLGCFLLTGMAAAQSDAEDKRIFGVLPNYRTAEASIPFAPLSARQKMTIACKDSFDWPVFPTAAAFATLYQFENQNPSFGQGMSGYATRFAAAVALSNAWYPDTRTVSDNAQKLLIQCATDAFSQVLKEFWPDVKRHFKKKHEEVEAASAR